MLEQRRRLVQAQGSLAPSSPRCNKAVYFAQVRRHHGAVQFPLLGVIADLALYESVPAREDGTTVLCST